MKNKNMRKLTIVLLSVAAVALMVGTASAGPITLGTEIGVDFGPTAPNNAFNQVDSTSDGSLAAGTLIDTSNVTVDGVGFSWSLNGADKYSNDDAADTGPTVFNTSNRTDWMGVNNGDTPGTITLTLTDLDDSLTYDLVIGAAFTDNKPDTSWEVDGQTLFAEATTANAYRSFTGLSTDGAGDLVMTGTGAGSRTDLAFVSALHLTAVPEPASLGLIGLMGAILLIRRRLYGNRK